MLSARRSYHHDDRPTYTSSWCAPGSRGRDVLIRGQHALVICQDFASAALASAGGKVRGSRTGPPSARNPTAAARTKRQQYPCKAGLRRRSIVERMGSCFWGHAAPPWSSCTAPGYLRMTAVVTATSSTVPHSNPTGERRIPTSSGPIRDPPASVNRRITGLQAVTGTTRL